MSSVTSYNFQAPSVLHHHKKNKKPKPDSPIVVNKPETFVTVKGDPGEPPAIGYPTSQAGILIPYVAGRQRVFQPNVLWYGNLQVLTEIETEVISTEIKEVEVQDYETWTQEPLDKYIFKTPVTTIQETEVVTGYLLDVSLGICLGPDVHCVEIYIDNHKVWDGDVGPGDFSTPGRTVIPQDEFGNNNLGGEWIFYDGRFDQNVGGGSEIAEINPPGYVGIAVMNLSGIVATDTFPSISFEVERRPNPLGLSSDHNVDSNHDINPMSLLYDVTGNRWGGIGINTAKIDPVSLTKAALQLSSEDNFMSIYNQQSTTGASILTQIESQIDGFIFVDPADDLIKCRLARYDEIDWETTPILDESVISKIRDLQKGSWEDAASKAVATFTNRAENYDDGLLMAQSPMVSGSSREATTAKYEYPLAMTADVASKLLARDMIEFNQPTWACEIQGNRHLANYLPGDPVRFSSTQYHKSLVKMIVTNRTERAGEISITLSLSEMIDIQADVLFAIPQPSLFDPPDRSPTSPTDAYVVSAPYWIQVHAGYTEQVWTKKINVCTPVYLVEAYNSLQATFDVRMLNFPDTVSPPVGDQPVINRNALYASVGFLIEDMGYYDGWNDGVINEIQLQGVIRDRYIKTVHLEGVKAGQVFMFIENEILSFEIAHDEGAGTFTLTNVHRGLLDTCVAEHPAGSKCWIINNNWLDRIGMSFDVNPDYIPQFRFCSRTFDRRQKDDGLDYSDWTPNNRINRPLPPMALKVDGNRSSTALVLNQGDTVTVSWKTRSRNYSKTVAIFADAAHRSEVSDRGIWQTHKVWLTDNDGHDYDLGETSESPVDENSLDVTIPMGASGGLGKIWVQALNAFGSATQHEFYRVSLTLDPDLTITDEDDSLITDENDEPITE